MGSIFVRPTGSMLTCVRDRKICSYFLKGNTRINVPCSHIPYTVLSRASAHGRSRLKHQKWGVGGYTEEVLGWFNYPCACNVSSQGVPNRLHRRFARASPVLRQGQPDGGESCIMLESGLTLVASLPSVCRFVVCEFRAGGEERCEQGYRRVCVKL